MFRLLKLTTPTCSYLFAFITQLSLVSIPLVFSTPLKVYGLACHPIHLHNFKAEPTASLQLSNTNSDSTPHTYKAHVFLTTSANLQNQCRELAKLHPNYSTLILPPTTRKSNPAAPLKKRFKIIHIGDSHIQNDVLSDAIRQQFQTHFGNAGSGFLFPYGLAKSYGPRGISAQTLGAWIDYKTMTPSLDRGLGITGYGLSSYTPNARIHLNFSDKFKQIPYHRLKIWHSVDSTSFDLTAQATWETNAHLNYQSLPLMYKEIKDSTPARSWGQSTFDLSAFGMNATTRLSALDFEFPKTAHTQTHTDFYGFQLETANTSGVEYQSYGVVGSQFTHFIQHAGYSIEQLKYLQPNIIIFSFGTNEAYNGKLNDAGYYVAVDTFLRQLQRALPNTAIVLSNCQDTRSGGRIPPKQREVNFLLQEIANQRNYAYFDLNAAMGGWNSIYKWQRKGLTLKDLVHFTGTGYSLQGKIIASALLEEYNQASPLPIDIDALDTEIDSFTRMLQLFTATYNNAQNNINLPEKEVEGLTDIQKNPSSSSQPTKRIQPSKSSSNSYSNVVHVVRSGESLYRIALRYNVTVNAIVKKNNLKNPKSIRPGQKLLIPRK
jgi:lysophospholipase L1-like esterase